MKKLLRACTLAASLTVLLPLAQAADYSYDAGNWPDNNITPAPADGGNHITISGVNSSYDEVYGARVYDTADTTSLSGNVIGITGSALSQIYGAFTSGSGNVTGNEVTISEKTTVSDVEGGYSRAGNTDYNHVTISGGSSVSNAVYGGWSNGGSATGNTVTINEASTVEGIVRGGDGDTEAHDNHVTISGGSRISERVMGASVSDAKATENSVTISGTGTTVTGDVYGAMLYGTTGSTASGNRVFITDGATITGDVYGANYAKTVTDNHVIIENATVAGDVYAGYAASSGTATNNSITLKGTEGDLTQASLYGGYSAYGKAITGNILTLQDFRGSVASINNFDTINFVLSNWEAGATLLTLTEGSALATSYTLNVDLAAWNASLGDTMTLISGLSSINKEMAAYSLTGDAAEVFELQAEQNEDGTWNILAVATATSSSDSDTTAAIPEPTTATLSLLALAGLAARRRRK